VVLGDRGRVAEALALHAQEERICRQLRDHRGACVSLANQARLLRDAADYDAAAARLEAWEQTAREFLGPAEVGEGFLRWGGRGPGAGRPGGRLPRRRPAPGRRAFPR